MERKRKRALPKYDDEETSNLALLTLDQAHETLLKEPGYKAAVFKSYSGWDEAKTNKYAAALGKGRMEYDQGEPLGMLMHYVARVTAGAYPDPDITRHIAQCFRDYLTQKHKTLDSAFSLKGSQNSKPVPDFKRQEFRQYWILRMSIYVSKGESRKAAASRVHDDLKNLGYHKVLSASSILREFRDYERRLRSEAKLRSESKKVQAKTTSRGG